MEVQVANMMSEMMSVQEFRKYNGDCNPKKVVLSGLSFFFFFTNINTLEKLKGRIVIGHDAFYHLS